MYNFPDNNLFKGKIIESIKDYNENGKFEMREINSGHHICNYSMEGEADAQLNIYYKNDGKTTLYAGNGKNTKGAKKLAEHIIEKCKITEITNKSLRIARMPNDDFDSLIEELLAIGSEVILEREIFNGKQFKLKSPQGDIVILNRFTTTAFQVQGSGAFLKAIILDLLTNYLPYKEVIEQQLAYMEATITPDAVLETLEETSPATFNFIEDKLKAIISPSLVLKSYNIILDDYSSLVFGVLRGLEGVIKQILSDNNIQVRYNALGNCFREDETGWHVADAYKGVGLINRNTVSLGLERLYTIYHNQRHGLFHIDGDIESTRIIENKQEAEELIAEVLEAIEENIKFIYE
ncbi:MULTISPECIES: RNase LS family HEPN domain-containing protein [unclassified Chitinophaga]|uniref:RNase LS family HEPN domain-containing protein n=1 Tax=unclassified Chitinophaga TaxID=2619133 RepID=UPI00300FAE22